MTILVTGVAGFIGYHVAEALLKRGEEVVGLDNINDYYDVKLKEARLERLHSRSKYSFHKVDLACYEATAEVIAKHKGIDTIVHLAAQAGVRYSLINPEAYLRSNVLGHATILEVARHLPECRHMVYASSSSVYGGNTKLPFSVNDRVDKPISLYAATKKSDELMSHCYSHLYGLPQTGLRFFTVYGPWGRPDMAMYIFCKKISSGDPIAVFNNGDMARDFTYIDDIVRGVLAALYKPPCGSDDSVPHRLFNIGNQRAEPLMRMIELIEIALGKKADIEFQAMQPGDIKESFADIRSISDLTGFKPETSIEVGIPKFVDWFKEYEGV